MATQFTYTYRTLDQRIVDHSVEDKYKKPRETRGLTFQDEEEQKKVLEERARRRLRKGETVSPDTHKITAAKETAEDAANPFDLPRPEAATGAGEKTIASRSSTEEGQEETREGEGETETQVLAEQSPDVPREVSLQVGLRMYTKTDREHIEAIKAAAAQQLEDAKAVDPEFKAYVERRHRFADPLFRRRRLAFLDKLARNRFKSAKQKKYNPQYQEHPDDAEVWPHNKGSVTIKWPSPFH
eukprot:GDKI01005230.1.p1 GENE.GDKI01005230.1~~GDKI01005230.1.p1  ORF type:complete len:241 (-),score=61.67 GDKI01005230.1:17-739(-)